MDVISPGTNVLDRDPRRLFNDNFLHRCMCVEKSLYKIMYVGLTGTIQFNSEISLSYFPWNTSNSFQECAAL